MKHLIPFTTALLTAFLAVLLLTRAVHSGPLADRPRQVSSLTAVNLEHPLSGLRVGSSDMQSTSEFSLTRIVTITVGTTTVPLTPGLNSRWQNDLFSQVFIDSSSIRLPADAYAISVTLINGEYSIDYSEPAILITNSQGLYYEYQTYQQALRFGNQILISQTYRYNRPLHHVATMIFTDPYQYVGYTGYTPTLVNARQLHWDESFTETKLNEFEAATWLVHPTLPKPDLEILTATVRNEMNHIHVAASIRNGGFMAAGAPAYLNLYDRLAPSVPPTGPLDLTNGWCSQTPFRPCGGTGNPLPIILPAQAEFFNAEFDLSPFSGTHDIYLYIDALGGSQGLNVESVENNNLKLAGSTLRWNAFIFLPLIARN